MSIENKGNLFIKRPKLAIVISLAILLAGILMIKTLPLEEYPSITPPQVVVQATYAGASSDVIESTIAAKNPPIALPVLGPSRIPIVHIFNTSFIGISLMIWISFERFAIFFPKSSLDGIASIAFIVSDNTNFLRLSNTI